MLIDFQKAAEILKNSQNVYVISHQSPDGDTLGSGFALVYFLRNLGKKANLICSDEIPPKFKFLSEGYADEDFEPECFIAVDIADKALFGEKTAPFAENIELCIDHHISNSLYAKNTLLNPKAAATCQVLFELFEFMGAEIGKKIATCLYTGLATDTGCFKFENTTPEAHFAAGKLISFGVEHFKINRRMFDEKSMARIKAEQLLLSGMEYFLGGKITMIAVTRDVMEKSGLDENEFEGVTSLTMQLEGVEVGITAKERSDGVYKISMRSSGRANVSEICALFGGGGHIRAAGCTVEGSLDEVKAKLVSAVEKAVEALGE
ncbi:MAG: bifunctional oligoribonuclease and phosphatase NrnA [Clostridiales bacterium]|jgi:phosphoesterase RecJ-like protein|nr:hypothetical protein [Oscillospiraceae bacterium]MDN5378111.1 bifunctional oligoribonuclease and phosphatase NrnA [Clostridiales bacterium]